MCRPDDWVSIPGRDKRFVSSPKHPYRLSVQTILLFNVYKGTFCMRVESKEE
jgi:hypothetical protein